jgi:hypothetical protein
MKKLKTIQEILHTVNKEDPYDVYSEDLIDLPVHLREWCIKLPAIKKYYIAPHYCTDSYVGLAVCYFEDKPVCYSNQQGRKCEEIFNWVDKEAYDKVLVYTESIVNSEEDKYEGISFIDNLECMVDTFYTVEYGEQLLTSEGYYKGGKVLVTKTWTGYKDIDMWTKVEINDKEIIPLKELFIPFKLKEAE